MDNITDLDLIYKFIKTEINYQKKIKLLYMCWMILQDFLLFFIDIFDFKIDIFHVT